MAYASYTNELDIFNFLAYMSNIFKLNVINFLAYIKNESRFLSLVLTF